METVAAEFVAERRRQIDKGLSARLDDTHTRGELADAAACYAHFAACGETERKRCILAGLNSRAAFLVQWWPWPRRWWRPSDRRRDLVKAGALIIAEIERLDRQRKGDGA